MNQLSMNKNGWIDHHIRIPSPNFDARPACEISLIVIHNISLPPSQFGGSGIIELFTNQLNPNAHPYYPEIYQQKVSAHFLIRRDGQLIQFVSCLDRAWHAGKSNWQGSERCNDFSVGIELESSDFEVFESEQYCVLNQLLEILMKTYPIQSIAGHSDISPNRKTDPGPFFDWSKVIACRRT